MIEFKQQGQYLDVIDRDVDAIIGSFVPAYHTTNPRMAFVPIVMIFEPEDLRAIANKLDELNGVDHE